MALIALEDKVISIEGKELSTYGTPVPNRSDDINLSPEMLRETSYTIEELTAIVNDNEYKLLPDQRIAYIHVYTTIIDRVYSNRGGLFFLDVPGGTDKNFVTSLILAKLRQQKRIALAVASSGIATTLLSGGRTAHSAFKLPLNFATNDTPVYNISKDSQT